MGGWLDGWVDAWVAGWLDGRVGGWVGGWMGNYPSASNCSMSKIKFINFNFKSHHPSVLLVSR